MQHQNEVVTSDGPASQPRNSRVTLACLQCRARKSKCISVTPKSCESCKAMGLACRWPAEDRRSAAARRRRRRVSLLRTDLCPEGFSHSVFDSTQDDGVNNSSYEERARQGQGQGQAQDCASRPMETSGQHTQPAQSAPVWFTSNANSISPHPQHLVMDARAIAPCAHPAADCGSLTPLLVQLNDPVNGVLDSMDALAWVTDDALGLDRTPATTSAADVSVTTGGVFNYDRLVTPSILDFSHGIALVSWRRPHGCTAITPGMKRIKLRVRLARHYSPYLVPEHSDNRNSATDDSSRISEAASISSVGSDGHFFDDAVVSAGARDTGNRPSRGMGEFNYSNNNQLQDGARHFRRDFSPNPMLLTSDGAIKTDILSHLLDMFSKHLSPLFPFLNDEMLAKQLETSVGPSFLLSSVAAISARFSDHPSIALPHIQPSDYGNPFTSQAKSMLGSMLTVPSRSTVVALALLAMVGAGNDSESEVWMFMGMATRMSQDMGLHLDSSADKQIKPEACCNDRLIFWSIFILDCALSYGVGRPTTFDLNGITQPLPSDQDLKTPSENQPSPFPYVCSLFFRFAPVINLLNSSSNSIAGAPDNPEKTVAGVMEALASEYTQLPPSLEIDASNMRSHTDTGNASTYVWLHMWFHAILVSMGSRSPLGTGVQAPGGAGLFSARANQQPPEHLVDISDHATRTWPGDGARSMCEIVNLANMTEFPAYCSIPLFNQPLFISASFFASQIELLASLQNAPMGDISLREPAEMSTADRWIMQKHKRSIVTLTSALENQTKYWSGIRWILGSLEQRIEGAMPMEVDLEKITEHSPSSVTLPDPGLLRSMAESSEAVVRETHDRGA